MEVCPGRQRQPTRLHRNDPSNRDFALRRLAHWLRPAVNVELIRIKRYFLSLALKNRLNLSSNSFIGEIRHSPEVDFLDAKIREIKFGIVALDLIHQITAPRGVVIESGIEGIFS